MKYIDPSSTRGDVRSELLEALYQMSLSDRMIASLCRLTPMDIAKWRQIRDYPPNDSHLPYNPKTGQPFSPQQMRIAIEQILDRFAAGKEKPQ